MSAKSSEVRIIVSVTLAASAFSVVFMRLLQNSSRPGTNSLRGQISVATAYNCSKMVLPPKALRLAWLLCGKSRDAQYAGKRVQLSLVEV
jgi:hypothetical protein